MNARYYIVTESNSSDLMKGEIWSFRTTSDMRCLNSFDDYKTYHDPKASSSNMITLFRISSLGKQKAITGSRDLSLETLFLYIDKKFLLKVIDARGESHLLPDKRL